MLFRMQRRPCTLETCQERGAHSRASHLPSIELDGDAIAALIEIGELLRSMRADSEAEGVPLRGWYNPAA